MIPRRRWGLALGVPLLAGTLFLSSAQAQGTGGLEPIPGCDIAVERQLARASLERIDLETELAKQFYRELPPGGFSGLSCLDRLLGGGINIIFSPPDIGRILSMLESRVCDLAQRHLDRAMQPLTRSLQGGVDLDRMLPGIGLGRITAGLSVSPQRGGGGPFVNFVNVSPTVPIRPSNGIFSR